MINMSKIKKPNRQGGFATLSVALSVLFLITLGAFSLNRQASVEVQIAGEQYAHTQAVEAAQAGINKAVMMINDGSTLGTFCSTASSANGASRTITPMTYAASCLVKNSAGTFYNANSLTDYVTSQSTSGQGTANYSISVMNPTSGNFNYLRITSTGCADSACTIKTTMKQDVATSQPRYGAINATGDIQGNGNTVVTGNIYAKGAYSMAAGATINGTGFSNSNNFTSTSLYQTIFNEGLAKAQREAAYAGNMITSWTSISGAEATSLQSKINAMTSNNTVTTSVFINNGGSYTTTDASGNPIVNADGTIGTVTLGGSGGLGSVQGTTKNPVVLTVGSADAPVVFIVAGQIHFGQDSTFNLWGTLYSNGEFHTENNGKFNLQGLMATIGDMHFESSSVGKVNFNTSILTILANAGYMLPPSGAYLKVMGSWRDF
jgi:Tfp pilus assembly protein PilX